MRMKYFLILFLAAFCSLWVIGQVEAVDSNIDSDDGYWTEHCEINKEAEKNIFIDDYGEMIYYNIDQKVLWELANDFCVSLELIVAYNFVLFPRKPIQYTHVKIPPSEDKINWIPGKSLVRPDNVPDHIAAEFYFDPTPTDQFAWPVDQEVGVVSQLYHNIHRGVDIGIDEGEPIRAIGNGRVIKAEENHRIYGTVVMIDHGNDIMAIYAHLLEINVEVDQFVSKEETIGLSGNTGMSSAPHLHFELRDSFRVTDPCNFYDNCPDKAFHGPPIPHPNYYGIEEPED
ncbi:MAG: M23 family metallopeptidase [Chloroflexota bacterium]